MKRFGRAFGTSFVLLAMLAGLLAVGNATASAQTQQLGNPLICTTIANPDGTYFVSVTLIEGYRFPLHLRRETSNGSRWIRTITQDQFGAPDGFPQDLANGDGYFIRYRRSGMVNDVPCFQGDLPQAPDCSIESWSVGSDAYWSVIIDSQDGVSDFTLFVNDEEFFSNDTPYEDGGGNQNVWFDLARTATPQLTIEVAPTAAKFRRATCGTVQDDRVNPGACAITVSDNNPNNVWIELDVDFPLDFTVTRNGADLGEPSPVKFADFPLSYLVPNDYYEVAGSTGDTYELRLNNGTGLVCTGITQPPPADPFTCTQNGSTLTWTDQDADGGRYHVRLDQGSSTKWESTVTDLTATVKRPNSRYLIRWRVDGRVFGRFCS